MASKLPPVRGNQYIFSTVLFSQADDQIQETPSLSAGDAQVSKDGGALANLGTLPSESPAGSGMVQVTLSAAEMTADEVVVLFKDAAGDEWHNQAVVIHPIASGQQFDDLSTLTDAAAADAVWDEVLTGATHNVSASAGRRLRELAAASIRSGTAQAGAANSITLDTGASATDQIYDNNLVVITGGTGAGQTRTIVEYNGTTKVAIVDEAWEINPDATSEFQILADQQTDITHHGLAQAGAASTITLSTDASAQDDIYNGQLILIRTSTGSGQARLITDYDGTTKVATIAPNWNINPTSASVYAIIPAGQTITQDLSATALASINADILAGTVEGSITIQEALRVLLSFVAGETTGGNTTSITFKSQDGLTNRIVMTVDSDGDRSSVVVDGS